MVNVNDKDEIPKSNSIPEADVAKSVFATEVEDEVTDDMEENEDEDVNEYEEEEEDEDDEDEYEEEEDEEIEEKVNDEGLDTDKEHEKGKVVVEDVTNKEIVVKEDEEDEDEYEEEEDEKVEEKVNDEGHDTHKESKKEEDVVEDATNKKNAVQEDKKNAQVRKSGDKLSEKSKSNGKRLRPRNRNKKKDEQKTLAANGEKVNDEAPDTNKEDREKVEQNVNLDKKHKKEQAVVEDANNKENGVKEDEKNAEVPKRVDKLGENSKSNGKKPRLRNRNRNKKKDEQKSFADNGEKPESLSKTKVEEKAPKTLVGEGDKLETSRKTKGGSKRVESMGMVFMCTSKTKSDCFHYKVFGLPGNKKDQVAKVYKGMRLFLFDVDLRLMYGIFKAAGPGGYNLEPKAFKANFPSQVRFTVLDDCLPLAEENFKGALKENYYSRNKFEGLLKADQVKKLCKLFLQMGRGGARIRPVNDLHSSRIREKRKRREREERRPHYSPLIKRRYIDYVQPPVLNHPILYEHEAPVPRYTHEIPKHNTYHIYSRDAPSYHDPVYTLPQPKYNLVSREYHPLGVPTQEYRLSGNSTSYRDVGHSSDYRSFATQLPEYRSQTHY